MQIELSLIHIYFNAIREEYRTMLKNQLSKGNNGLAKTKYITFGIEAENLKVARPRLETVSYTHLDVYKRQPLKCMQTGLNSQVQKWLTDHRFQKMRKGS